MEYTKGLVSIIMPMYNAKNTISQAIESVVRQTYTNWELLIVDDCSEDGCVEQVEPYLSDSRIMLQRQPHNRGVAEARNVAMDLANGQYLAFLDSDDLWKEDKLRRQLSFMEEQGAAFVYSAYELVDSDAAPTGKMIHVPKQLHYREELKGNSIPCLTVLIDRTQIPVPHMPDEGHEDYITWLNILKTGVTAYGQDEALALYRVNGQSLSGNKVKAAVWTWKIYKNQGLNWIQRCYYFGCYVFRALKKHA